MQNIIQYDPDMFSINPLAAVLHKYYTVVYRGLQCVFSSVDSVPSSVIQH